MTIKADFYIIAHNIRSLYNVGTVFRTADALGVSRLFLSGYSGCPPRYQIAKVALGSEQIVSWERVKNIGRLIRDLKKQKIKIVALEEGRGAKLYSSFKPSFPLALIIGNEVRGISRALLKQADAIIYLPMYGHKESLNVGVALGAAGYYLDIRRRAIRQ
ncbi:MAG: RNA methyltransferase [Parcubacteria group bacterium]|nr:MAG: RNA methyltransferase [Parcubacteria group bacterium]